ncbi:MAG: hypothetical protein U0Q22_19695 [Acidimicrobiales bacterium]
MTAAAGGGDVVVMIGSVGSGCIAVAVVHSGQLTVVGAFGLAVAVEAAVEGAAVVDASPADDTSSLVPSLLLPSAMTSTTTAMTTKRTPPTTPAMSMPRPPRCGGAALGYVGGRVL